MWHALQMSTLAIRLFLKEATLGGGQEGVHIARGHGKVDGFFWDVLGMGWAPARRLAPREWPSRVGEATRLPAQAHDDYLTDGAYIAQIRVVLMLPITAFRPQRRCPSAKQQIISAVSQCCE